MNEKTFEDYEKERLELRQRWALKSVNKEIKEYNSKYGNRIADLATVVFGEIKQAHDGPSMVHFHNQLLIMVEDLRAVIESSKKITTNDLN